jgi:DNA-binding transcriptional MocR family regulator
MSTGWIKLSRDMTDHWLWTGEFSRAQAWIDLLLHASHSDSQKMIIKGEVISWERGQQIRSIKTLEKSWGWSRSKVNRFLELLEKDGMIERKGGHLTTIISVCNYDSFQSVRTSVDTSVDTSNGHLTDISRATNKNVNNEKNEKKSNWLAPDGLNIDAWNDFVEHRKTMKKPLSDIAKSKSSNILKDLDKTVQQETVDKSIQAGWAGLFPEKQNLIPPQNLQPQQKREMPKAGTEE